METLTKNTVEQKKHGLEQKLELAKELELKEQVAMIWKEIKVCDIEQTTTYEKVTVEKCRELLCPKTVTEFKAKRIGHILPWKRDWVECQHGKREEAFMFSLFLGLNSACEKIVCHTHTEQPQIVREKLGTEKNTTALPTAALILMREAKSRNLFDHFEIWRPETQAETKARLDDPWLVGCVDNHFYKLCDWR